MKKSMMICSIKAHVLESGILGKSFTGSNQWLAREVMRCDVLRKSQMYMYSNVGPERKTDNLSVQKSYIALFLKHNFEEVLG